MNNTSLTTAVPTARAEHWLIERAHHASRELNECVEINPKKLGGVPVLKGTRISVAQVLAEFGEGRTAEEIADDFEIDATLVKKLIQGLAASLDRPVSK